MNKNKKKLTKRYSNIQINNQILKIAQETGLRVGYVEL